MNVNDIICVGARPLAFIDYIAVKSSNENLIDEIVKGLVEGSKQSEIAIVGGETAILPDLISGRGKNAFDLAGMVLGITSKSHLVLGDKIKVGDVILGIERIYVRPIMEILEGEIIDVDGFAHITGGSFTKLSRLSKKVRFNLNQLPNAQGIFKQIQVDGHVKIKEMYKTFNMGIGFCVIISKDSVDRTMAIVEKHRMNCMQIGIVDQRGKGEVIAHLDGRNVEL
jgi:phosphoribosylformylglycinamidine cyclo-ligase